MKFSIALDDLESMLRAVLPARALKTDTLVLSACAARVFVASQEGVAGMEALVFTDGAVELPAKAFREVLKTYKGTRVLVFEGGAEGLRVQNFHMPVLAYDATPKPPGDFQVFGTSAPPAATFAPTRETSVVAAEILQLKTVPLAKDSSTSLPLRADTKLDPVFVASVGKPVLRAALQAVLAAYKAGKSVVHAIEEGMAFLRANVKDLDEQKAKEFFDQYVTPAQEPTPATETPGEATAPESPESKAAPEPATVESQTVSSERGTRPPATQSGSSSKNRALMETARSGEGNRSSMRESKPWKIVIVALRWIAVLPCAILASGVVHLIQQSAPLGWWVLDDFAELIAAFFGTILFAMAGAAMAPTGKLWVTYCLASIWPLIFAATFSLACFYGPKASDVAFGIIQVLVSVLAATVVSVAAAQETRKRRIVAEYSAKVESDVSP